MLGKVKRLSLFRRIIRRQCSDRGKELSPNTLCHYTKIKNYEKIIKEDKFDLSEFCRANDYKEMYEKSNHREELDKHRYFSLVCSRVLGTKSMCNPVMWYFYGDKHRGVCIEFDKTKLLQAEKYVREAPVMYRNGVTHYDRQQFIDYVFEKRLHWENEEEHRILYGEGVSCIKGIRTCIKNVYFGAEVPGVKVQEYREKLRQYDINVYKMRVNKTDGRLFALKKLERIIAEKEIIIELLRK